MKIVFLDIDGVLVNKQYSALQAKDMRKFDPDCVKQLNRLLEAGDANVVVSSTWRLGYTSLQDLQHMLWDQGVACDVVGTTPQLDGVRGEEIQEWLDVSDLDIESFVILDDDSDMAHLLPFLVKTTFDRGLIAEHVDRALEVLRGDHEETKIKQTLEDGT